MGSRSRTRPGHPPFPDLGPTGRNIPISTGSARLVPETDGSVLLMVNGVPSSHLDPDPQHLVFEYMRWIQTVVHRWADAHPERTQRGLRIAHLGGGGCALPRALAAQFPRARQIVVEIDALLGEYARSWFDLPRSPQLRLRIDDATHALATWREGRFDILVRDVFAPDRTPAALTDLGAARHAARVLAPGGLYLANCAAAPGTGMLADELATLSRAFAHLEVISEGAHLRGKRRGNCVIAASQGGLPEGVDRALRSDPVAVRLAPRRTVDGLRDGGRVLTTEDA